MATETSVTGIIRASRPSFRNAHDKVAFAVHATFLASGYALVATGTAAFADPVATGEEEVGIEGWNEFEDSYGFVYVKADKGGKCKVIVKCVAVEDVLAVDALKLGSEGKEPFNLQLKEMYKNLGSLVDSLKSGILDKIEPHLSKVNISSSSASGRPENEAQRVDEPAVGVPIEPQVYPSGLVYPHVPPSRFSDIYPGIGAGVFPERGRFAGDGSMLIGPNDPRWFGGMGGDFHSPGNLGGIPGVPPGVRFDPYGPPNVPGFEPSRFIRQPPQRPGGGVHPDLQHFQALTIYR